MFTTSLKGGMNLSRKNEVSNCVTFNAHIESVIDFVRKVYIFLLVSLSTTVFYKHKHIQTFYIHT